MPGRLSQQISHEGMRLGHLQHRSRAAHIPENPCYFLKHSSTPMGFSHLVSYNQHHDSHCQQEKWKGRLGNTESLFQPVSLGTRYLPLLRSPPLLPSISHLHLFFPMHQAHKFCTGATFLAQIAQTIHPPCSCPLAGRVPGLQSCRTLPANTLPVAGFFGHAGK